MRFVRYRSPEHPCCRAAVEALGNWKSKSVEAENSTSLVRLGNLSPSLDERRRLVRDGITVSQTLRLYPTPWPGFRRTLSLRSGLVWRSLAMIWLNPMSHLGGVYRRQRQAGHDADLRCGRRRPSLGYKFVDQGQSQETLKKTPCPSLFHVVWSLLRRLRLEDGWRFTAWHSNIHKPQPFGNQHVLHLGLVRVFDSRSGSGADCFISEPSSAHRNPLRLQAAADFHSA